MMISSLSDFQHPFFIGIAGSGMSAIAQYLKGIAKNVSGSDRFFVLGEYNETKEKLEAEGIKCFVQNGEGITAATDLIVVSTAIEDMVMEVQKAKQLNIPVVKRSELLAMIAASKKTIAVAGTSGKSTTSAMLFDILGHAGYDPSIISGAGLISIIKKARPDDPVGRGKIGNAKVGKSDWLVIEADESDGSIVQYKPEIGLLLNVDKDHQEIDQLMKLFGIFKSNSKYFSVNQSHLLTQKFSQDVQQDFSTDPDMYAGYMTTNFKQEGLSIRFKIQGVEFKLNLLGKHNMENAVAAVAVANGIGVSLETCAEALRSYEGIYRRHQVYGKKNGVWLIDDYAHNPVKCAAAIEACQPVASKVIAWFQPHGYKPTKFLRQEFVKEIADALRPEDEIWMSEIFYAGGTAVKDISANDLINDLKVSGKAVFFIENRDDFLAAARTHFTEDCVLLLMGARDPSLEQFAKKIWEEL
jgi:UDP-N-acetylmuramate--alanine ligase